MLRSSAATTCVNRRPLPRGARFNILEDKNKQHYPSCSKFSHQKWIALVHIKYEVPRLPVLTGGRCRLELVSTSLRINIDNSIKTTTDLTNRYRKQYFYSASLAVKNGQITQNLQFKQKNTNQLTQFHKSIFSAKIPNQLFLTSPASHIKKTALPFDNTALLPINLI